MMCQLVRYPHCFPISYLRYYSSHDEDFNRRADSAVNKEIQCLLTSHVFFQYFIKIVLPHYIIDI